MGIKKIATFGLSQARGGTERGEELLPATNRKVQIRRSAGPRRLFRRRSRLLRFGRL